MDIVNNTTVVNVFNIIGGLGTLLSVTLGAYLVLTKCCKGKRCVCRIQICEPIEEEFEVEVAPTLESAIVEVPNQSTGAPAQVPALTPAPVAETLLQPPGEVVRTPVATNPVTTEGETITLIRPPARSRYF